jgi:hypothetical protein
MYAGTLNHRAGSTVYKHYPGNRWSAIPYDPEGAPIRSTATFEGRLFIGEGNNAKGAKLFYTINGDGWTQDGAFARPYDFSGVGGEVPLAFHALTPVYVSTARGRQGFLYVAVQYVGAGVKIWRRTLDLWDSVMSSLVGASDVGLPLTSRWRI